MEYTSDTLYRLNRAHPGDAGLDITAVETTRINPTKVGKIATGIRVAIPTGYYGQLASRSSFASYGAIVVGGVIDSGYRGEVVVMILNTSNADIVIQRGDRIAQLIVLPIWTGQPTLVTALDQNTSRGTGGFGSTGV